MQAQHRNRLCAAARRNYRAKTNVAKSINSPSFHGERIETVKRGDVKAAQGFLRDCADALREKLRHGGVNLDCEYADYLADCLENFSKNPDVARLFCLRMPKHRPKGTDNPEKQFDRAMMVLEEYQCGRTIASAIKTVAKKVHRSEDAVRASWKAYKFKAQIHLILSTSKDKRKNLRLAGSRSMSNPKSRG